MAAATASSVGVEFPTKEEQGDLEPSGINTWSYVQRWKAFREHRKDAYKKVAGRAAVRRKLSERSSQKRLVHRSMPLELLAREWLNEQRASIENRAYLVDKVLPTLVIGIEKLLNEVCFIIVPWYRECNMGVRLTVCILAIRSLLQSCLKSPLFSPLEAPIHQS